MKLFKSIWNYCKLSYNVYELYTLYDTHKSLNTDKGYIVIDTLKQNVEQCGSICIKFCQWITPILELIYTKHSNKDSYWLKSLETLYENCPIHSLDYSKGIYHKEFGGQFDDDYTVEGIIGSGSIGQVYKIKHKHTHQYFAFKVSHPDILYEFQLFRMLLYICLFIPYIRKKLYNVLPVNYYQFIDKFEEQMDMVKESNNLLRINYNYRHNSHVIIPRLIKCSSNCMIMTYEEGDIMDDVDISGYQKTKIISLLYGFITSNQLVYDIMHTDIHKANWKIRKINDNIYSIVIYDFGYCHTIHKLDRPIIHMMTDMFEISDENIDISNVYIKMIQYFVNNYSDSYKQTIYPHIPTTILLEPEQLFTMLIHVCKGTDTVVDAKAIQLLVVFIQCYKYLKQASINNGNNLKNDGYRMYRERYIDLCNLYTTYDCFHEFRDYMINKLSRLPIDIDNLFDTIQDNETVSNELKHLIKFDF
jgi:serine/threonine protein kinase